MADLNKLLDGIQKDGADIEHKLKGFLGMYEELFREANRQFSQERSASSSMQGLEEFYRLVQTVKRNRDVVGSLLRGMGNMRSLVGFKFVEEDDTLAAVAGKRPQVSRAPIGFSGLVNPSDIMIDEMAEVQIDG
jgi:hypothetical protein